MYVASLKLSTQDLEDEEEPSSVGNSKVLQNKHIPTKEEIMNARMQKMTDKAKREQDVMAVSSHLW
jgi:hypothetical protein